ncbi:hypothetical protein AAMO2058_001267600 [Amorphochlora amoebiformis]
MGVCTSEPDDPYVAGPDSKKIDKAYRVHKLLMLGAGESGKTTLFKQLTTVYGTGFTTDERKEYGDIIRMNILESMQNILKHYELLYELKDPDLPKLRWNEDLLDAKEHILRAWDVVSLGRRLTAEIKAFWNEPAMRYVFDRRDEFQVIDTAPHFLNRIDKIAAPDYLPSDDDILRCRARTTGIIEGKFTIKGEHFEVVDVGGQRNERKKWIHHFETCRALLFVVALSAYSQKLWEDNRTNRMIEAIELFDQVANSRWFQNTPIVLFLNKSDLFAEKIKTTPLTLCKAFSKYDGDPHDYTQTTEYLADYFFNLDNTGKNLYIHLTCATDRKLVEPIFESLKDAVLEESLAMAGM